MCALTWLLQNSQFFTFLGGFTGVIVILQGQPNTDTYTVDVVKFDPNS